MKTTTTTTTANGQSIEQIVQKKLDEVNPVVKKIDWTKLSNTKK